MSNFYAASSNGDAASREIMLFGVRLVVDSMRKSVSLNNLSQYAHPNDPAALLNAVDDKDVAAGYASADEAVPAIVPRPRSPSSSTNASRERKRGVPWTEDEHKLFLLGLQKVGKGDWRGISRNFVKTRTPSQVASHAQKYFLRRSNLNRRRRRSSLFDITTESVCGATTSNDKNLNNSSQSPSPSSIQAPSPPPQPQIPNVQFTIAPPPAHHQMKPVTFSLGLENQNWHTDENNNNLLVSQSPIIFHLGQSNTSIDLNRNRSMMMDPLSLSLSLSSSPSDPSRQSPFQIVGSNSSSFSNGDSMISVA